MGAFDDLTKITESVNKVTRTADNVTRTVTTTERTVENTKQAAATGKSLLSNPWFWGIVALVVIVGVGYLAYSAGASAPK